MSAPVLSRLLSVRGRRTRAGALARSGGEAGRARRVRPLARSPTAQPNSSTRRTQTHPILRASPFPEVTDPICRLPLPTLFYRLEAAHLGDLMRLWVRPGVWINLSIGFSRVVESAPDTQEAGCFPIPVALSPGNQIPGSAGQPMLKRKENSSRGSRWRLRFPLCHHTISTSRFGNMNPIPFRALPDESDLFQTLKRALRID